MFSDLKFIIFWWLTIFGLGVISLPLIFYIFKKFWDKGYIFSKIVSISLITYFIFVLGVIKLLPFTTTAIFGIVALIVILDIFYLSRKNNFSEFKKTIKSSFKAIIFEESLFLLLLIVWSYVRGFTPAIEGLEKYMDWGFINSALRSNYLPPADMWFAGSTINYYYFGHLIFALLTKISSIPSSITYNLSVATLCALTFVSGFSITSNLTYLLFKKPKFRLVILSGLVAALLLTFGGNLHTVYKIAATDIKFNGKLELAPSAIKQAATAYWYPDATRFIGYDPDTHDKTIHEFPGYSFVVADLHGHMNDIPVVLFFVAMLFVLALELSEKLINWKLIIGSGLILSIAYMTNAWDFAIYGLLFGIFLFISSLSKTEFFHAFNRTFLNGVLTIAAWYLFSLPFSLNFSPMTEGVRLADAHTPFYQLFVLYGGFWLIVLPFILYSIYYFFKKVWHGHKKFSDSDLFVLSLALTATVLIILPEIGYIKDIYVTDYRRANTMFKFVYEAFIMYSLITGYVVVKLSQSLRSPILKNAYKILFFLVFLAHMIYPYFSIKSFYRLKNYVGLDGLSYLKKSFPDNYNAISWMNQNIDGQPVIVEAVGDSYTTYNHVSVSTGLPTVEGWIVHEWLWRGGYDKPAARSTDVDVIYTSKNLDQVRKTLQKYKVEYIFVGAKEFEKYPKLNIQRFDDLGAKVVYQSGETKIYKI